MSLEITTFEDWRNFLAILTVLIGGVWYSWPHVVRFTNKQYNAYQLSRIDISSEDREYLYQMLSHVQKVKKRSETHGIKEQIEEATQIEAKLRFKLRYHVRFFPLAQSLDQKKRDRFVSLMLKQNTIQSLYQFELGYCKKGSTVESQISEISKIEDGSFIEKCEVLIQKSEGEEMSSRNDVPRIIITDCRLPWDYILLAHTRKPATWHTPHRKNWGVFKPGHFFVISLASFRKLHPDIPEGQFLLRQIQRICMRIVLPSETGDGRKRLSHDETRGCLFDFIPHLYDVRYFINLAFICEDCVSEILEAHEIPEGYRKGFLDEFQKWLNDTLPEKHDA